MQKNPNCAVLSVILADGHEPNKECMCHLVTSSQDKNYIYLKQTLTKYVKY